MNAPATWAHLQHARYVNLVTNIAKRILGQNDTRGPRKQD
jgi:hypothetical protein